MKYIIILLLISCKVTAQPPSLSSFSTTQQYQLKKYVGYEIDSISAVLRREYKYYTDYTFKRQNARIDSLAIALDLTNDTLSMLRKTLIKPSAYDFLIKDTTLIWNNDNFYISNGQIVRKK